MRTSSPGPAGLLVLLLAASPLDAQIRGSERALVTQTVDGTTISVDYGRPHIRGREPVFGGLVDWNHIWTPGANWATILDVDKDVHINGTPVPEGRYSLWMVANPDEFEIVLDPADSLFHTMRPPAKDEQIRFMAAAVEGPPVEALTFSFPLVRSDGTELLFQWGKMNVSMDITVPPTRDITMAPEDATPFSGTYAVTWHGPPPETAPPAERPASESTMELRFRDDQMLVGSWDIIDDREAWEIMMAPAATNVFNPGWMRDGKVFEIELDLWVEFVVEDGKASGFEIRDGMSDMLLWSGDRLQ